VLTLRTVCAPPRRFVAIESVSRGLRRTHPIIGGYQYETACPEIAVTRDKAGVIILSDFVRRRPRPGAGGSDTATKRPFAACGKLIWNDLSSEVEV
jgi:hypothetical protein